MDVLGESDGFTDAVVGVFDVCGDRGPAESLYGLDAVSAGEDLVSVDGVANGDRVEEATGGDVGGE